MTQKISPQTLQIQKHHSVILLNLSIPMKLLPLNQQTNLSPRKPFLWNSPRNLPLF